MFIIVRYEFFEGYDIWLLKAYSARCIAEAKKIKYGHIVSKIQNFSIPNCKIAWYTKHNILFFSIFFFLILG